MSDPKIVNLSDLPWTPWSSSERIGVEIRDPARKLGSSHCGFRMYRLAPGKQATRLHRHLVQEEMFLILAGEGTLRHGDPAPHTFINSGVAPMEYLATGERVAYEVCEYPEDGTVYIEALDKTLRNEDVTTDRAEKEAWFKAGR